MAPSPTSGSLETGPKVLTEFLLKRSRMAFVGLRAPNPVKKYLKTNNPRGLAGTLFISKTEVPVLQPVQIGIFRLFFYHLQLHGPFISYTIIVNHKGKEQAIEKPQTLTA